ncbi:hypothetical protein EVJ30_04325 [Exiguobacterium sp. SH5S13]|nr:hypothetical protein EVJ30_04325 [Exiguobacterium sp. SH5S13]
MPPPLSAKIVMRLFLIRYPRRRRGTLTESRTFVRYVCHRDDRDNGGRAIHLNPTLDHDRAAQWSENSRLIYLRFVCLVIV